MSRCYSMSVEIKGYNPAKETNIKEAMENEWNWEDYSTYNKILSTYGDGNLCAGETEEEFAERISKAIWKANEGYCEVAVNQTCLEDLPCDTYHFNEEDYKKIMG